MATCVYHGQANVFTDALLAIGPQLGLGYTLAQMAPDEPRDRATAVVGIDEVDWRRVFEWLWGIATHANTSLTTLPGELDDETLVLHVSTACAIEECREALRNALQRCGTQIPLSFPRAGDSQH